MQLSALDFGFGKEDEASSSIIEGHALNLPQAKIKRVLTNHARFEKDISRMATQTAQNLNRLH